MSTYSLVQRGVISATSADGAGPKDATLTTAIKTGSSFVVARIKDRRRDASVQRAVVNLTNSDSSPKVVNLAASVDANAAVLDINVKEIRAADPNSGVEAHLMASGTTIVLNFDPLAMGDTIDLAYQVIEHKPRRGASVRILNSTTVRMEWDGTLAAGETIDAAYDVFDLENFGDDMKEALFRLQRLLGYQGENCVQDNITYDDAGNMTAYRLRVFSSKTNAEAATLDLEDGEALETGELVRIQVTQDINIGTNDRLSLYRVLTDLLATPGVD